MGFSKLCPSEPMLLGYALGGLAADELAQVEPHVATCPECTDAVSRIRSRTAVSEEHRGVSAVLSPGAHLLPTQTFHAESALEEAKDDAASRFDLSVLGAPARDRSLGRLGKYDVVRELGHGGYGVVFEGWDEQLHRAVAIKVLNRQVSFSPTARRRFLREARAAAAINHPHVVTIYAVEEHAGNPFLVMELLTGSTLRERIQRGPKLDVFAVIRIGAQVAAALAAAHAHGVIHRDVKPANILFENNVERAKITDFGLARVAIDNVELTSGNLVVGTPAFMSPEQVTADKLDSRSDLFSLGAVLYAMFAGHSPFHGRTALETAKKVTDANPIPLHILDPSVPQFLSEIVMRLLAKSPNDRFQSAAELADVLNAHVAALNQAPSNELSATLRKASYIPDRLRAARRRQWGFFAGVTGACLVAAALAWTLRPTHDSASPATIPPSGAARETEEEVPPSAWQDLVTVAKSGDADCRTLNDALRRLKPGGTLRVLDDALYREAIVLNDRERWAGITLSADHGAVLAVPPRQTLLLVHETPGITVHGFRVRVPSAQRGIEVTGNCPGLTIEDLQVETDAESGESVRIAFMYIHGGAAGSEQQPMTVRRVTITGRSPAIVVGEQSGPDPANPVRWLQIEDCKLMGASAREDYLCVLFAGIEHLTVRRNIFTHGACAISVSVDAPGTVDWLRDVTVNHCTFYDFHTWLIWKGPLAPRDGVQFRDNLILRTDLTSLSSDDLASVGQNWFVNNWWETSERTPLAVARAIAKTFASIPVVSTDPSSADFLVPDFDQLTDDVPAGQPFPGFHQPVPPAAPSK